MDLSHNIIIPENCNSFTLKEIRASKLYQDLPQSYKNPFKSKETICNDILIYYTQRDVTIDNCMNHTIKDIKESVLYKNLPNKYKNLYHNKSTICDNIKTYYTNNYETILSVSTPPKVSVIESVAEKIVDKVIHKYGYLSIKYQTQERNKYGHKFDGTLRFNYKNQEHIIRLEYDGFQHFDRNHYWNNNNGGFDNQVMRDKLKEYSVYENSESLIRVYNINKSNNTIQYLEELISRTIDYICNGYDVLITIRENIENLFNLPQYKNYNWLENYDMFPFDDMYQISIFKDKNLLYHIKLTDFLTV